MLPSPLQPPTLRDDLPRYPHLIQLIRVTATTVPGPAGVAQFAGSSVLSPSLYVGFTQQVRNDSLLPRDREPCLVADGRVTGITSGLHLGRLVSSFNGLPVYEVVEVADRNLVVKEVGGSPSVTNPTTIELPNDAMSVPSPGIARLLEASLTTGGTVNLGTSGPQQLGNGQKNISYDMRLVQPLEGSNNYVHFSANTNVAGGGGIITVTAPGATIGLDGTVVHIRVKHPTGGRMNILSIAGALDSLVEPPYYAIWDGSQDLLGTYDTLGPITTVSGGIITSTSGTFFDGNDGTF